jgi:hypothetical protein
VNIKAARKRVGEIDPCYPRLSLIGFYDFSNVLLKAFMHEDFKSPNKD